MAVKSPVIRITIVNFSPAPSRPPSTTWTKLNAPKMSNNARMVDLSAETPITTVNFLTVQPVKSLTNINQAVFDKLATPQAFIFFSPAYNIPFKKMV